MLLHCTFHTNFFKAGSLIQKDQKNTTPVQKCIAIFNILFKYAITLYFSYQFLQSWNFLLCKILKVNCSLISMLYMYSWQIS